MRWHIHEEVREEKIAAIVSLLASSSGRVKNGSALFVYKKCYFTVMLLVYPEAHPIRGTETRADLWLTTRSIVIMLNG